MPTPPKSATDVGASGLAWTRDEAGPAGHGAANRDEDSERMSAQTNGAPKSTASEGSSMVPRREAASRKNFPALSASAGLESALSSV